MIKLLLKEIDYDELTYHFISENRIAISFNGFNCTLGLTRKMKDGFIDLEKSKRKFRSNLSEATREEWQHKSEQPKKNIINNLKMY